MIRKRIGGLLIVIGILLMAAAGLLLFRNNEDQVAAENASQEALERLEPIIMTVPETDPDDPTEIPDFQRNPDMDMPTEIIDGVEYVGTIEIPLLGIKLPVINTSTKANLKKAPCRYCGSTYQNNLVIGAHNYNSHFGRLKTLSYGDEIIICDLDGNEFRYQVADIEILQPNQLEDLIHSDWALTLYTCTIGGRSRVVVRCEIME